MQYVGTQLISSDTYLHCHKYTQMYNRHITHMTCVYYLCSGKGCGGKMSPSETSLVVQRASAHIIIFLFFSPHSDFQVFPSSCSSLFTSSSHLSFCLLSSLEVTYACSCPYLSHLCLAICLHANKVLKGPH